ncbi:50S ribosomal protein L32 [Candidatus Kapabacteria bacterium]|nr:50S ribosomal protein L32 [Candidatus Kapabacteria bacterium]
MAHPKRKISKSRRDKRRTHYKIEAADTAVCPATNEIKMPHRATIIKEGNKKVFYYNGRRFD